jgi:hypothetical protein
MRDVALHANGKIERFKDSNRIRNLGVLDMTDSANIAEYERALGEEIRRQNILMNANGSFLPRWMRHGEAVERYNFAAGELANLQGAQRELVMFKEDLRRYERRTAAPMVNAARPGKPDFG